MSTLEEIREEYERDIAKKSLQVIRGRGILVMLETGNPSDALIMFGIYDDFRGKIRVSDFPEIIEYETYSEANDVGDIKKRCLYREDSP